MANLNRIMFMGNITRDPELKYLPNGTAVTTFTVASNRSYKPKDGEKKEEVTFMRIVVWGKRAESCGEYLHKGSSVFVEGRIQNRTWEGEDGQKKYSTEIVADNVQFLGGKQDNNTSHVDQGEAKEEIDVPPDKPKEDDVPF